MSRGRAWQLIGAAKTVEGMSTTVDKVPTSEWQIRPLAGLEPEDQQKVWDRAVERDAR